MSNKAISVLHEEYKKLVGNGKYKDEFYKDQQIGHWSNE